MQTAIEIKNLTVVLGSHFKALNNISLELPQGKVIGIIGPSGAGKTTLIRAIVGRLQLGQGNITVLGQPAGSADLRRQVSYMTQELSVYSDLTVRENLTYFAVMSGQPKANIKATVEAIMKTVDMTSKADDLVDRLSGGQKQRVSLAVALIGSPRLLVLDEPTVGLDPVLREELWGLFARLASEGVTLIVSSHSMDEAERCDDLVLVRNGEVIAHSSPKELCERTDTKSVEQGFLKLVGDKE